MTHSVFLTTRRHLNSRHVGEFIKSAGKFNRDAALSHSISTDKRTRALQCAIKNTCN